MKIRPCIDVHNGKVKQIVGGSLTDEGNQAVENFVSTKDAGYYAKLYREHNLKGGHIILLNSADSVYYEKDVEQALLALHAYPGGLQIGGGITDKNARKFLEEGASHVIVTSFVFQEGTIQYENLKSLRDAVGKDKIVLDLSCRKKKEEYYIVTNRWQTFTNIRLSEKTFQELSDYCDEFLIHAVDVEGKASGIDIQLIDLLSKWSFRPITYAGGVASMKDIETIEKSSHGAIDITIGSGLDLFGGPLPFEALCK